MVYVIIFLSVAVVALWVYTMEEIKHINKRLSFRIRRIARHENMPFPLFDIDGNLVAKPRHQKQTARRSKAKQRH